MKNVAYSFRSLKRANAYFHLNLMYAIVSISIVTHKMMNATSECCSFGSVIQRSQIWLSSAETEICKVAKMSTTVVSAKSINRMYRMQWHKLRPHRDTHYHIRERKHRMHNDDDRRKAQATMLAEWLQKYSNAIAKKESAFHHFGAKSK